MAHLIKIGNSQGVRIPKSIIEQSGLEEGEFTFQLTEEGLLLRPVKHAPRQGWKEQFETAVKEGKADMDKEWLETPLAEEESWEW